jgi:hypothetical protein
MSLRYLFVFGPADLAACKALIENVKRCRALLATGSPNCQPDNVCEVLRGGHSVH